MTQNLEKFLLKHKGETLVAVFPHPDDSSFVAGGLFQLLQKIGINTKLICLTDGKDNSEFKKSCNILGIDEVKNLGFDDKSLAKTITKWETLLKEEISKADPFMVLTFDPGGVTGHPDHVITSVTTLKILKADKNRKPLLLWRIADKEEKKYFGSRENIDLIEPTFHYNLNLSESIKKLRAIFTFETKMKNFMFRMRVLEWYLFDHKELYYNVDFKKHKYELLLKEI